jgi:putative alpha-1,2-mannosidase
MYYNGILYNNNWLDHATMLKGGVINFNMSAQINTQQGVQTLNFPYALSYEK